MTLMRDTTSGATARLVCSTSRSTPSTRKRTTSRFSNGSMWMSEAFSLTAWVSSALISRMIGASSSLSSRSDCSGMSCAEVRQIGVVVQPLEHLHRTRRRPRRSGAAAASKVLDRYALELQRHAQEAAHLGQGLRGDTGAADAVGDAVCHAPHQHAVTAREGEGRRRRCTVRRAALAAASAVLVGRLAPRCAGARARVLRPTTAAAGVGCGAA